MTNTAIALLNTTDFNENLASQEAYDALAHEAEVAPRCKETGLVKYRVEYTVGKGRRKTAYIDNVWADSPRRAVNDIVNQLLDDAIYDFEIRDVYIAGTPEPLDRSEWKD